MSASVPVADSHKAEMIFATQQMAMPIVVGDEMLSDHLAGWPSLVS